MATSQTPQRERKFFDYAVAAEEAALREVAWKKGDPWRDAIVATLDAAASRVQKPKILDLGCGLGRLTVPIAKAYPKAKVYGVDISPAMIERAREMLPDAVKNVEYLICDGRQLPDLDEKIHATISVVTFQHIPFKAMAGYFASIADSTVKGGLLHFQYVEGDPAGAHFLNHPAREAAVREALDDAGWDVDGVETIAAMNPDVWRWVLATKR